MHSSRMCTAHLLTICRSIRGWVSAQGDFLPGGCMPRGVCLGGCLPRGCLPRGCLPKGVSA